MTVPVQAGLADVTVTSASEVNLLTAATGGTVGFSTVKQWSLVVTTNQDITVRVYKQAGPNAGLVIVSGLTDTATSSAPYVAEWYGEANTAIRVTAQASAATATVDCDFRGVGSD